MEWDGVPSFGVRGIQVMLNGIPLTSPDGQTILEVIDPNMIRSAEIIRGPNAVFWGNGQRRHGLPSHRHCRTRERSLRYYTGSFMAATGRISPRPTTLAKHGFRLTCPPFRPDGYRNHSRARLNRTSPAAHPHTRCPQHAFLHRLPRPMRPTPKNPGSMDLQNHNKTTGKWANPLVRSTADAGKRLYPISCRVCANTRETEGQRFETVIFGTPCVICAIPSSPSIH